VARLGLYQPFIEDRNVRRLYRLKVEFLERTARKVPMTTLVNRILDDFFDADISVPSKEDETRPDAPDSASPLLALRR